MSQQSNIVYPPGVRDLTEEISTDDLVRRLKECAQAFQNMSQEEDNSNYIPLALLLASETFLEHRSRDVRLLVACCIADVFRVYAPEAPYKDVTQLKVIFEFFVDQLRGLKDPQNPSFKLYFYLLENLSCVKTFNICFEFEDNQKIISCLFKLMFKIINENHNAKLRKFMLDMLSPLITEADLVHQELLDIILSQIIEPVKSQNKIAFLLAEDILKRTASTLEPYVQTFFNNALIIGRPQSDITRHLFDLIYELNVIVPSMMVMILPQLECKLKSGDETERLQVTKVVARMFSDKKSNMIDQNKSLWSSLLLRFHDISPQVRLLCVQYSKHFLLNHPESKDDITELLKQRTRDQDEEVRYAVIVTIVETAREDFDNVSKDLLECVRDRTLDKKFRIRKEAILGLARVYKKYVGTTMAANLESISWIKNKVLHMYYQSSLEDKLLVERIIHTCFVPYQKPMEERMKLLYQLYCSIDANAVKAFKEILRCQILLRSQMKSILENIQRDKSETRLKAIANKVNVLSKNLQDPAKSKQFISKFCKDLEENIKLRSMMSVLLNKNITCVEAENKVKEILKCLGNPVQSNSYYMTIKQLLERIAPVMIDKESIKYLVLFVKDSLIDSCAVEAELGLQNSAQIGLELLLVLSYTFPHTFHGEEIYNNLMLFLQTEYGFAADSTLQILINVVSDLEVNFPEICMNLLPLLENFVETGSSKQAKHAVYCINNIVSDKQNVFGKIIDNLKKHLTLKSQYFRTALVSIGHIAFLNSNLFATDLKAIISKIVIYDLLMLDQDFPRGGTDLWGPLDSLPDETKCKIEGMKVMVRWLAGLKVSVAPATSTLRLLTNILDKDGELGDRNNMAPVEKSWMRISAASCMLKLCHEPKYSPLVDLDSFLVLASTMNDNCPEVCERFAKKLYKGLFFLKLPLEYLAIFSLAGFSSKKEFQEQIKKYLRSNINKRRMHLKEHSVSNDELPLFLPDYSVSYAVYLLAHSNILKTYNDVAALRKIKECLKLLLDSLMVKNENYSFPFFKRLLENIKQTKDIKSLPDISDTDEDKKAKEEMNWKMYAVCDLALNIVLSKPNHILKEFPAEPSLNLKFFTDPDKSYSNMKTYLPPELLDPLKAGFEVEMFDSTKSMTSISSEQTTVNATNHVSLPSTSCDELETDPSISEEQTDTSNKQSPPVPESVRSTRAVNRPSRRSGLETSLSNSKLHLENEASNCVSENSDINPDETSNSEIISKESDMSSSKDSSSVKNNVMRRPRIKPDPKKKPEVSPRSTRSSRTSSLSLNLGKSLSVTQQNGNLTSSPGETSTASSCVSNFQHLIKECNVSLRKDEVENYTAKRLLSPSDPQEDSPKRNQRVGAARRRIVKDSSIDKNVASLTDNSLSKNSLNIETSETLPKRNVRSLRNSEPEKQSIPVLSKRKRDASGTTRSVRSRTDPSSNKSKETSSSKSPVKSPIKNGRPVRAIKSIQKSNLIANHSPSTKVKTSIEKGSKDSKTLPRVNNLRSKPTNTKQKKKTEVKTSGKRR